MVIDYKKIFLNNIIDATSILEDGEYNETDVVETAVEWTIEDCCDELKILLRHYVDTEEFHNTWEKVK